MEQVIGLRSARTEIEDMLMNCKDDAKNYRWNLFENIEKEDFGTPLSPYRRTVSRQALGSPLMMVEESTTTTPPPTLDSNGDGERNILKISRGSSFVFV